jgi:hypothetical protein
MVLLALGACSGPAMHPDAGMMIDTSCGIDCASQTAFGLLAHQCFEYSDTMSLATPPALAAEVQPVATLEGGVTVMPVIYSVGGQLKMKDSFTIKSGVLTLVRREWYMPTGSVSYQTTGNALDGVAWITADVAAGENQSTMEQARVIAGSTDTNETTTYRVTATAPSATDLNLPLGIFDGGVKLLFAETPDHGSDSRRVFAPGVGFGLIATPLAQTGGTSQEYRLQKTKSTADGGMACGFQ